MFMCNLLKLTQNESLGNMCDGYVGNARSTDEYIQYIIKHNINSTDDIEDVGVYYNGSEIVTTSNEIPLPRFNVEAPPIVANTTLNDDQINDVMSYLLELQDKYFADIPLSEELCKAFVWNIPVPVYERHYHCREYEKCDLSNPLFLFYIFCTENPYEDYDMFMGIVHDIILDEPETKKYFDQVHESLFVESEDFE